MEPTCDKKSARRDSLGVFRTIVLGDIQWEKNTQSAISLVAQYVFAFWVQIVIWTKSRNRQNREHVSFSPNMLLYLLWISNMHFDGIQWCSGRCRRHRRRRFYFSTCLHKVVFSVVLGCVHLKLYSIITKVCL